MNNFQTLYEKYIVKENVEFEICLGKQVSKHFTNCINKSNFNKVKTKLNNQKCDKIEETNYTEYLLNEDCRKINDVIIHKLNIYKYTKKINKYYDLKLTLSHESPIKILDSNSPTKYVIKINKKSYFKDFYRFDLKIINNDIYEIEMKLVDKLYARKHSYDFIINNMVNLFQGLISSSNFKWST